MATIIVVSIPAVACVFMLYALIEFHREPKRPRLAAPRVPKGVILFHSRAGNSHANHA